MKSNILFFLLIFSNFSGSSQTFFRANNIKVFHGSKELMNPFTGGFNATIINRMDLDGDGLMDLVLFNKNGAKTSTFLNTNTKGFNSFKYTPKYETNFPKYLENQYLLRDFNSDGVMDIITKTPGQFIVFYGIKNGSTISYKLYNNALYAHSFIGNIDQQITSYENFLPIVEDVDLDGDLDIINADNLSNAYYFFKNYRVERNLKKDSICLMFENTNYGQFNFTPNPLVFNANVFPRIVQGLANNTHPLRPRHNAQQSFWGLDVNNDHLLDLCGSNEYDHNSPLGINRGTKDSANIYNYDTFFPSYNTPIFKWSPYGTSTDLDNDGKKDLIISSLLDRDNINPLPEKTFNSDIQVFQTFKNYGPKVVDNITPHSDSFALISDTFLVNEHIDVGTQSAPIFFDYNNDSLKDILIPNNFARDSFEYAQIALYKNIGTKNIPKYSLVTKDYMNFHSKLRLNIRMVSGDLNGDHLDDLLVTSYLRNGNKTVTGNGFTTVLYEIYYQSKGANNEAVFNSMDTFSSNKILYGITNPALYDIDEDGLLDLFIGEAYKIRYHRNMGTASKPNFSAVTKDSLITIDDLALSIECYFYPMVVKDSFKGKPYLYFGYNSMDSITSTYYPKLGVIGKASIDKSTLMTARCPIISTDVFNVNLGLNPTISTADINMDSIPDFVVGNYNGGIQLYSYGDIDSSKDVIPKKPIDSHVSIKVPSTIHSFNYYPNPVQDILNIDYNPLPKDMIEVYSIDGHLVLQGELKSIKIDFTTIQKGFYFVNIISENESAFRFKIIKE